MWVRESVSPQSTRLLREAYIEAFWAYPEVWRPISGPFGSIQGNRRPVSGPFWLIQKVRRPVSGPLYLILAGLRRSQALF